MAEQSWMPIGPFPTAYVHWHQTRERGVLFPQEARRFVPLTARPRDTGPNDGAGEPPAPPGQRLPPGAAETLEAYFDEGTLEIPLPEGSENDAFEIDRSWLPDQATLDALAAAVSPEAVITGIVDTGIAIGNARFQAGAGTRVLASWQQGAAWSGAGGGTGQSYLPFGQELYKHDIERLMRDHSRNGRLDEEAFNRAARISEPMRPLGQHDVEFAVSHGTHVLDLAAGAERDADDLYRRPILAVNMPARHSHGTAGNYLEFFASLGVLRIVALADAIWFSIPEERRNGLAQFPVVINLSFGMQAGPKDGTMDFERIVRAALERRRGNSPIRVVMPVGNDNLARCGARLRTEPGAGAEACETSVLWRILPQDVSSNFVELWTEPTDLEPDDLFVQLHAPDGRASGWIPANPGFYTELSPALRLYSGRTVNDTTGEVRYQFVIASMPSHFAPGTGVSGPPPEQLMPAGAWRLRVRTNLGPLDILAHIQSDQSTLPQGAGRLRSYFDHPAYRAFTDATDRAGDGCLPSGQLRDSYTRPYGGSTDIHQEPWASDGPIQRKGTLNAIASLREAVAVGGYRRTDGRPAVYSSSGFAADAPSPDILLLEGRDLLTVLMPADDSPAHPGLLASGTRSGATGLLRGTSMAAALATREVVEALLDAPADVHIGTQSWFLDRIAEDEASGAFPTGDDRAAAPKRGQGRMRPPESAERAAPRLELGRFANPAAPENGP